MDNQSLKVKKFYNRFADEYKKSRETDFSETFNIGPAVMKLLGNIKNKKILDVGCGTGLFAQQFAKKGAVVIGIDISSRMIDLAQKEITHKNINFLCGDILTMPIPSQSFDIITCILVTGHIENLKKMFQKFRKILKPDGYIVVTFKHPIRSQGERISYNGNEGYFITNYFKEGKTISQWKAGMQAPVIQRPLSTSLKALVQSGFIIQEFLEPHPPKNKKAPKLYDKIPANIVIKAHILKS